MIMMILLLFTAMLGVKKKVRSQVNADIEVITKPMSIITLEKQLTALGDRYLSKTSVKPLLSSGGYKRATKG